MIDRKEILEIVSKSIQASDDYGIAQIHIATLMNIIILLEPKLTRGDLENFYFRGFPGGTNAEIPAKDFKFISEEVPIIK